VAAPQAAVELSEAKVTYRQSKLDSQCLGSGMVLGLCFSALLPNGCSAWSSPCSGSHNAALSIKSMFAVKALIPSYRNLFFFFFF